MLNNLLGKIFGQVTNADEPEAEAAPHPEELFQLYRGEEGVRIVGLPKGARADEIEHLTLIQMGPGTSEQDCIDFLQAIRDALPPHQAKNIIVTRETDIKVFRWKKVEEISNG